MSDGILTDEQRANLTADLPPAVIGPLLADASRPTLAQPGDPVPVDADAALAAMLSNLSGILKIVSGVMVAHGRITQSDAEAWAALAPLAVSLLIGLYNGLVNAKAHKTLAALKAGKAGR